MDNMHVESAAMLDLKVDVKGFEGGIRKGRLGVDTPGIPREVITGLLREGP